MTDRDRADRPARTAPVDHTTLPHAVAHTACGHVTGLFRVAADAERCLADLTDAGYTRWQVRPATDADVSALCTQSTGCDTCRPDGLFRSRLAQ